MQAAIEYLEKYGHGHGSKIEIENDCTWGKDCTPSLKDGKNSELLKGRQNKYQSYCDEFQGKKWGLHEKGDAGLYILILKVLLQVELADKIIIREIIETIKLLGLAQGVRPIILIGIAGQVIKMDINQAKGTTIMCA